MLLFWLFPKRYTNIALSVELFQKYYTGMHHKRADILSQSFYDMCRNRSYSEIF